MDVSNQQNVGQLIVKQDKQEDKNRTHYWSKHRITLIAYQTKFVFQRKQHQIMNQNNDETCKKKTARSNTDPRFQNGFLDIVQQSSIDFQVKKLIKNYQHLKQLFQKSKSSDFYAVKQFINHLLQLKHSVIVQQFCNIYNIIVMQLREVKSSQVIQEKPRFTWLQRVRDNIINKINEEKEIFPFFCKYLKQDFFSTRKLILVEIYCLVAQKFNFNINQYYAQTFQDTVNQKKSYKRVKRDKQ